MGLDTTHDCWSGPYSSFARWREEVARVVGVPLPLMEGFYSEPPAVAMDWAEPREGGPFCGDGRGKLLHTFISKANSWLPLSWEALRPDPIHVLLNHSDCDGEIEVGDCIPLAVRLEEIAPLLPDEPKWHRGESARAKALQFAAGLRAAAEAGEPVKFG
jgi:hypothetical protein